MVPRTDGVFEPLQNKRIISIILQHFNQNPSNELEKLNTPTPITNRAIGVYFCEFKGTYYMPNKMLATEYPD
ncbi:hypothetical protein X777_06694, partial [Ooceraea biroi]